MWIGGSIEYQPGTNSINGWRNMRNCVTGGLNQQRAFVRIVGAGADGYGPDRCILHQLRSALLLDRRNTLAFLRKQCRLRCPYLRRAGGGRVRAAYSVVPAAHNAEGCGATESGNHILNRVGYRAGAVAAIEQTDCPGVAGVNDQRTGIAASTEGAAADGDLVGEIRGERRRCGATTRVVVDQYRQIE